jgi:hypothetical protein
MMIQSQTLSLKKCSFQRNAICLPPDIAFQAHLLSQMNEHRENDLNMLNEVIQCVNAHAIHYIMDYTTLQILSRKQLVQLLTNYQLIFLKPTPHSVPLTDGSVATVPIFDVKALLIAFLNDPLRLHQENFASNYDIFTGKVKLQTSTVDEIHTGTLWDQARQKYCGDDPYAFPLALVCVYDKKILMYLVHFHVHHLFVYHHSSTKTVAMMTQITWCWVVSPILDMEKEKQNNKQLR